MAYKNVVIDHGTYVMVGPIKIVKATNENWELTVQFWSKFLKENRKKDIPSRGQIFMDISLN